MNAVRAEWTKVRTTPGPAWLLLATATVTVALGAAVTAVAVCPPAECGIDVTRLALSGVYLGQAPVAVLAVLTVSGEYSTALIVTTLAAIPRRPAVLAAKALVLTAVVGVVGSLTVLASLVVAEVVLPPPLSPTDGPVLRAGAGTAVYLALVAILSLGVAAVVRDSGAAIGAVLGLLYLPPVLTQLVSDPDLHRRLEQLAPMTAGLAVQAGTDLARSPIGPWAGIGVLAAWSAGALLAGTLVFRSRDA